MAEILIVEDEADLRELIADEIECLGHSVTVARDGKEALQQLASKQPQVILSDINMPNMNGCEFRQEVLQNFPHLSHVPFVFVSAYAEREDIANAMDVGADHFVVKPIDFEVLHELVSNLAVGGAQADDWSTF